jgi:hypothetical protein
MSDASVGPIPIEELRRVLYSLMTWLFRPSRRLPMLESYPTPVLHQLRPVTTGSAALGSSRGRSEWQADQQLAIHWYDANS